MRRSQAPSMRKLAKAGVVVCDQQAKGNVTAPMEMQWGTTGGYKSLGPRKYDEMENPLKDKRIFLVLWRHQSNKKHKTWTGNGTLELMAAKVTLKDESGKVLGVLTCFKREKIQENALVEIDTMDVEIQEELKTADECISQRKEEIENWYRKHSGSDGGVHQRSELAQRPKILKKARTSPQTKYLQENCNSSYIHESSDTAASRNNVWINPSLSLETTQLNLNEYICMLSPAELQYETLQLLADHCQNLGSTSDASLILEVAQLICDHPVLLKHMLHHPIVSELLLPRLPPWQEMGLYDSAKFEFVHQMLDNLVITRGEKCAVVANSQNCLDIIKGYCECWEIPFIQLENIQQVERFNASSTSEHPETPMVALIIASNMPTIRFTHCKYVILYNYSTRTAVKQFINSDNNSRLYTLITSDCLEERQFQEHLGVIEKCNDGMDLLGLRVKATQELIAVQPNMLLSWKSYQPPFSEAFFKETYLSEEIENLRYVFC